MSLLHRCTHFIREAFFNDGHAARYQALISFSFSAVGVIAWSELHSMMVAGILSLHTSSTDYRRSAAPSRFNLAGQLAAHPKVTVTVANYVVPALAVACLVTSLSVFGAATSHFLDLEDSFSALRGLFTELSATWAPTDTSIPDQAKEALLAHEAVGRDALNWIGAGFSAMALNYFLALVFYVYATLLLLRDEC